jgi:hypothetical protein
MGFLDGLLGKSVRDSALWLYVRCNQCGAKIRVRISLANDLSMDDDGRYVLRKEIMDSQCFQLLHAELNFDERRRLVSRELSGGEFITAEEWRGEGREVEGDQ